MILTLVYQGGIANVFNERKRVLQSGFRTCEEFCRGAEYAGAEIRAVCCNKAGDIADLAWDTSPENAPFSDQFNGKLVWFKAAGFSFGSVR